MSRQTDLEGNTNRTPAEDEELRTLQALPATGQRVLRPDEEGYVIGKTTYTNAVPPAVQPQPPVQAGQPMHPYPQQPSQPVGRDGPTEPVPPVQPQRPRRDGTVPVKGDKDWIRYAGPDAG